MAKEIYITAAQRTPIGSFGGKLSGVSATELGAHAIRAAVEKSGIDPEIVRECIMGNVVSANLGQAPARQAARGAMLSDATVCTTVNKVCASGMKAITMATQSIILQDADVIVAGGMENMSQIPYYLPKARYGARYGHTEMLDGLVKDGLTDVYNQCAMGVCADNTAARYGISRQQQDDFAIESYKRSAAATESGYFLNEISPITLPQKKGDPLTMAEDEEFRNVIFDKIPTLKPVFSKEGTVTAANASTINDGAAALVLMSAETLQRQQINPVARVVSYADAEQDPMWFTTAPQKAAALALQKAGLTTHDIDFYEVNEAFSVVALAFIQDLGIDKSQVNVFGGAVSLGHPLGASGARIVTTLINVLRQKQGRYGLAAICNGGGGASAIIIERL